MSQLVPECMVGTFLKV